MSHRDLARALGVSPGHLTHVLKRERLSRRLWRRIHEYFEARGVGAGTAARRGGPRRGA